MNDSVHQKGCDGVIAQCPGSQDTRGSASPKGEARRKCAAKPERSEGRGGRTTRRRPVGDATHGLRAATDTDADTEMG